MNYVPLGPTNMLNIFKEFFITGQYNLLGPANWLLSVLIVIVLAWSGLQWAADESGSGNILKELIRKIILIGFFIWFVKEWPWIVDHVVNGFVWAGTRAGNSSNTNIINDPSAIVFEGLRTTKNLVQEIANSRPWEMGFYFQNLIIFFLIIGCYAIIAIQVFLIQLEFGIIATLGIILLPFGIIKQTAFMAEKVFSYLINVGIKLMVLSFILSITYSILLNIALPDEPNLASNINVLVCAAILMFSCWFLPNIAAAMLTGTPSLSARDVAPGGSRVVQVIRGAVVGGPKGAGTAVARSVARGEK